MSLPVDGVVDEVVAAVADAGAVVVTAPPGSGKTTRVPPALLDALAHGRLHSEGGGQVWLVQPRRVAARLAARRIADERGTAPGEEVGWKVRFDTRVGPRTRLVAMTDGMLLRELQRDPFLEAASVVVLDEVHERGLDLDLALALLVELRRDARPDLGVVVMSATLDAAPVARFLGDCRVVHAEGRVFPVDVRQVPRDSEVALPGRVSGAVRRLLDETSDGGGHLLAFLPGVGEINRTAELLDDLSRDLRGAAVTVVPLHGRLSLAEQTRALAPSDARKVVLATNIAETSVTMDGVVAVVDGGLARRTRFDVSTGITRLETVDISKASADQRAGRAGRTRAGIALRLWTAENHRLRPAHDPAEVLRADLSPALLRLLDLGIDPGDFRWLEPPPAAALKRAEALLRQLGAIDDRGLTPTGRALAAMPVHPRLGAVVLAGEQGGCLHAAATVAAIVSEGDPWPRGHTDAADLSEMVDRVDRGGAGARRRVLASVRRVREQLLRGRRPSDRQFREDDLVLAVLAGFPERLARRRAPGDLRLKLASGRGAVLRRPTLAVGSALMVAVSLQGRGGARAEDVVDLAVGVSPELVRSLAEWRLSVSFDAGSQRVVAEEVAWVGALDVARRRPRVPVPPEAITAALLGGLEGPLEDLLALSDDERSWLARLRFVAHHLPELELPALDENSLKQALSELAVGCRSLADLRKRSLKSALEGRLSWKQSQAIEQQAPARLRLPSGSTARVTYSTPDRPPVLAARIQQVFGWEQTPRVAKGRVPVVLHLLAPNMRPAQITADLASFWDTTWADVRKDLRGRYPKHAWPEDPRTAVAHDRPRRKRR